jgi:hypothetical protein
VYAGDSLSQVDPAMGAMVRPIAIPTSEVAGAAIPRIDAGGGTVWMAGGHALNRIDLK